MLHSSTPGLSTGPGFADLDFQPEVWASGGTGAHRTNIATAVSRYEWRGRREGEKERETTKKIKLLLGFMLTENLVISICRSSPTTGETNAATQPQA